MKARKVAFWIFGLCNFMSWIVNKTYISCLILKILQSNEIVHFIKFTLPVRRHHAFRVRFSRQMCSFELLLGATVCLYDWLESYLLHSWHQSVNAQFTLDLRGNINCVKALLIQRALDQLEHMTEVVFVSQSVTANYHSFHSSSRLDKHLAEIVHRSYPSGEFKTQLLLGQHSFHS